jgi:hypothetical protein
LRAGASLAKTLAAVAASASAESLKLSTCEPSRIFTSTFRPCSRCKASPVSAAWFRNRVLDGEQPNVGRHHRRRVADPRCELLGRVIGEQLLEETQHHAQQNHHEDDRRRPQVTGQIRQPAQRDQQDDQRILDVSQQAPQGGLALFAGDLVRSDPLQARIGLRLAQTFQTRCQLVQKDGGIGARLCQQPSGDGDRRNATGYRGPVPAGGMTWALRRSRSWFRDTHASLINVLTNRLS